ncbi:hypothetical protein [Crenobacter cavernae]|uniref:Cytochrome C oxidase subunit I n=1 Tax=Crenobacter cavernae TaxID=2290923 RepID=A0A345Y5F1_9NEIS|nr:hypothetical protein [Crenobacter cavernae]AXK39153.1 hypothetical protein DWG20_06740 [Crenobacter cavernae]
MSLRNLARLKLLLLALFCASPVLGAWVAYQARLPEQGRTVGTLLPTRPFAAASVGGWPQGKWVLAVVEHGECGTVCQGRLFATHQWQAAQGEATERLRRVLLTPQGGAALDGVPRLSLGDAKVDDGVYLIDPLGNQVMFYADNALPTQVIREVARILKTNNGLG